LIARVQASNIWYGHAHALTWVQSQLPKGFKGTSYDDSGWVRALRLMCLHPLSLPS